MLIFLHKKRDLEISSKSLKSTYGVSNKYQHTFNILSFIFRLKRLTVDTLTFISSAQRSSGISWHRSRNKSISILVKLHSLTQYSISGLVKLHIFKNVSPAYFFLILVPLDAFFPFFFFRTATFAIIIYISIIPNISSVSSISAVNYYCIKL